MVLLKFLKEFKEDTEYGWSQMHPNPDVYGPQIQKFNKWKPGLSQNEISAYEKEVGFNFPNDMKTFLSLMNGWTLPQKNEHGSKKEKNLYETGLYSYPENLKEIKDRIKTLNVKAAIKVLNEETSLEGPFHFLPIYSHRYVVCGCDTKESLVISAYEDDVIIYGKNLQNYLKEEFLKYLDY